MKMSRFLAVLIVMCLGLVAGCGVCHGRTIDDAPGYRPAGEGDAEALLRQRLGKTSFTVFPTVVRSFSGSAYDTTSRARIVEFFKTNNLATVNERDDHIDLCDKSTDMIQFNHFQKSMSLVADHLKNNPVATEYVLVVECLVTPTKSGGEAVGGIQCYLLDSKGHNAFSFLLNFHHPVFREAKLKIGTVSADAQADLICRSTEVVVEALHRQLQPQAAR